MSKKLSAIDEGVRAVILPMFAYTSGELHVGHVLSYTIPDIITRSLSISNIETLQPFGFDSFGLPGDIKAQKEGIHPYKWNKICVDRMSKDISMLSLRYDICGLNTCHASYHSYSQHLFVLLTKAGYIEKKTGNVWYAPLSKTVLANEQVVDGKFDRTGEHVERRELDQ